MQSGEFFFASQQQRLLSEGLINISVGSGGGLLYGVLRVSLESCMGAERIATDGRGQESRSVVNACTGAVGWSFLSCLDRGKGDGAKRAVQETLFVEGTYIEPRRYLAPCATSREGPNCIVFSPQQMFLPGGVFRAGYMGRYQRCAPPGQKP